MDPGVKRPSQANQTIVVKTPATMSSDQSTPVEAGVDLRSPRDRLEQHSHLPDSLPTADLPELMAPFQPNKSKLQLLPDELLLLTVEALAPANFTLKSTKDYQASRTTLHSLCLVSKTMDVFARPVLYRDLRLYSYAHTVRLSATLLTYPILTSHVKSILFFPPAPYREKAETAVSTIDLRPLRFLQDPDFAYWTRGRTGAKVRMPLMAMEKMVYNLVFKILSRTPALEALYLRLHSDDGHHSREWLQRSGADAQYMQEVDLQRRLLVDFCEGSSRPNLPNLKTVGVLGGNDGSWSGYDQFRLLFQSFFMSPNLQEVHWAGLDHAIHGSSMLWNAPFEADWYQTRGPQWTHDTTDQGFMTMSRSVTRIKLQAVDIDANNIVSLTKAFPSLESLTVQGECDGSAFHMSHARDGSRMFQYLGMLDNFHTLELDVPREAVAVDVSTESGPSRLVMLSAMSKLHTLVVPVDFFVGFTSEDRCTQRIMSTLPDSLRCLTLLLNDRCASRLLEERGRTCEVRRVVGKFLWEEVAPALLVEFPHLEKVDLCYHIEHYHQNKVYKLAARSLPDATSGVEAS